MGTAQSALAHLVFALPVLLLWKRPAWSARRETETLGPERTRFRRSAEKAPPFPSDSGEAVGPAFLYAPPLGRGGTLRVPQALVQMQLGREQTGAQSVGAEGPTRVLGLCGHGLTFGRRQTRSGRECWGRSCGGYPEDCYLWWKEGIFRPVLSGSAGCKNNLSALVPLNEWAMPPSLCPAFLRCFGYRVSPVPTG